MMTNKRNRIFPATVITAALALVLTILSPPSTAEACGGYAPPTPEMRVENAIGRHLHAVTKGDRKAINANWALGAGHTKTLVRQGGVDKVRSEAIGNASRRWAKNKDEKMVWNIEQIEVDKKAAFAKVNITWHGQKRIEYLTLLKVNNAWTIVSKVHVAAEKPKAGATKVSLY